MTIPNRISAVLSDDDLNAVMQALDSVAAERTAHSPRREEQSATSAEEASMMGRVDGGVFHR